MSERRKLKRNLAAGTAAFLLAAGVAGKAEARTDAPHSGAKIETAAGHEPYKSLEQLSAETVAELKAGEPINFYYGKVHIYERDGSGKKFIIRNPILIPRTEHPEHPNRVASPEYALGYFRPEATAIDNKSNLGGLWKLQVIDFRRLMKFVPNSNRHADRGKSVDVIGQAKFKFESYGLDIYNPMTPSGSPLIDHSQPKPWPWPWH